MNDLISWDSTLVKKFSSSNHFKLLNQLRNEVKKYPLNNKKNSTSIDNNDSNTKITNYNSQNIVSKNSNPTNDNQSNNSTVSFNNAKNFSIYNTINNDSNIIKNEKVLIDQKRSSDNSTSPSFNDRLNQIDFK